MKIDVETSGPDGHRVLNFSELGIIEPILKSIEREGFIKPTKIQEQSIPVILSGKDVIADSKTGSGKTLAFATAIIDKTVKGAGIQAIVLTPTRELTLQVVDSIKKYSMHKHLVVTPVYGGVSINPQIDQLKYTDVVVGTPGRILDHLSRGTLNLSKIRIVVLDEADRMLDMGFIVDVKRIMGTCPNRKQTLLYSATITSDIYDLAKQYMHNPVKISVETRVDPKKLIHYYYQVPQNLKFSLLVHLIKTQNPGLAMVFCNTQRITDNLAKNLQKHRIKAIPIHGGLSQAKRTKTLEYFQSGKVDVLVCTDVAGRGIHVEDVSCVYNYDVPKESRQYIHRVGRTARVDKMGKAITLLSQHDYQNFDRILRDNSIEITRVEMPKAIPVLTLDFKREHFQRNNHRRQYHRR